MTRFSAQQKKQSFLQKRIPPEAFKPQGGLLFGSQIHFSQYTEFVFARYGGVDDVKDELFISLRETFFEVLL